MNIYEELFAVSERAISSDQTSGYDEKDKTRLYATRG